MSEYDQELGRLKLDVANKSLIFQNLVNSKLEDESKKPDFDLSRFAKELQNCSPEGIDYNIAIEKLNKFKVTNNIL